MSEWSPARHDETSHDTPNALLACYLLTEDCPDFSSVTDHIGHYEQ